MRSKAQESNPRCSRALQTSPFSHVLGGCFQLCQRLRFCILFVGFNVLCARLDFMLLKPLTIFPTSTETVASPSGIAGSENVGAAALGNLFVTFCSQRIICMCKPLPVILILPQTPPARFPSSCSRCAVAQASSGSPRDTEEQRDWSSQLAPGKGDKNGKIKQIFWWFCCFASCTHKILSKQRNGLFQTHLSLFQTQLTHSYTKVWLFGASFVGINVSWGTVLSLFAERG